MSAAGDDLGIGIGLLRAESAIRRTIALYCQTCDDGRFAEFADCFTPDAVLTFGDQEVRGRTAIGAWIAAAQPPERRGRHATTNSVIDVAAGLDRAAASTDYLFLSLGSAGRPAVSVTGRYRDALVPVGDRWLIQRREISILGR
ncbi:MAG: nuclear transport factor 2 family protein [Mycobacteriales bacterium]